MTVQSVLSVRHRQVPYRSQTTLEFAVWVVSIGLSNGTVFCQGFLLALGSNSVSYYFFVS